jgi:hypothetical protein
MGNDLRESMDVIADLEREQSRLNRIPRLHQWNSGYAVGLSKALGDNAPEDYDDGREEFMPLSSWPERMIFGLIWIASGAVIGGAVYLLWQVWQ